MVGVADASAPRTALKAFDREALTDEFRLYRAAKDRESPTMHQCGRRPAGSSGGGQLWRRDARPGRPGYIKKAGSLALHFGKRRAARHGWSGSWYELNRGQLPCSHDNEIRSHNGVQLAP